MKRSVSEIALVFAVAAVYALVPGCGGKEAPKAPPKKESAHDHEGHDHGHDHAHDHDHHHGAGPNGGAIIMLGNEEYHAEWLHDEASGKVTFILLDAAMKKEVSTEAKELTVEVKAGKETRKYTAAAVAKSETQPQPEAKASRFEVVDKALAVDLEIGGEVVATVSVEIGGKVYSGKPEPADEHDHATK